MTMHDVLTRREKPTGMGSAAMSYRGLVGVLILALLVCLGLWLSGSNPPGLVQAEGQPAGSQSLYATAPYTLHLPLLYRHYQGGAMPYGIQILDGTSPVSTALDRARHAQMQWARFVIKWRTLEPVDVSPAAYDWAAYDDRLHDFASAGLRPIVVIMGNPSWAAPTTCGPITPAYMADFQEFVGALVARYSRPPYNVKVWEIYNEPDNTDPVNYEWLGGCWGNQGAEYANMLKAIYPVIKAADPGAQVSMGGLAYDYFNDSSSGPFNREFLDDVIQANGAPYFDVMNFHFYRSFSAVWEAERPGEKGIMAKANYLRAKLATYNVTKPFICSETGMWSDTGQGGSDVLQSRYVAQAFARGMAANLDVVIWFRLADSPGATEWLYGLLNGDLSRKPAYAAYQTLTSELPQMRYLRRLTVYDTGNENIEGYEFEELGDTGKHKGVLWTNNGATYQMAFPVSAPPNNAIRWAPMIMYGSDGIRRPDWATIAVDGGPHDLDSVSGQVTILIGPDPVYVSAYP